MWLEMMLWFYTVMKISFLALFIKLVFPHKKFTNLNNPQSFISDQFPILLNQGYHAELNDLGLDSSGWFILLSFSIITLTILSWFFIHYCFTWNISFLWRIIFNFFCKMLIFRFFVLFFCDILLIITWIKMHILFQS